MLKKMMYVGLGLFLFCLISTQGQAELVSEWKFDGNARDSAGNNHGALKGNPTWGVNRFGDQGKALSFDGKDDYVDCGNDVSLNITDAITIEAWVYSNGYRNHGSAYNTIINKGKMETDQPFYHLSILSSEKAKFVIRNDANSVSSTISIKDAWRHLVGVRDGDTMKLYVDGILQRAVPISGSMISTNNLFFGKDTSPYRYFKGTIDDVRIYNHALSPEEVKARYENKNGRIVSLPTKEIGSASPAPGVSKNLISGDSSFETGPGNLETADSGSSTLQFELDPTTAVDGNQSMKLQFSSNRNWFKEFVSIEQGKTYTFSLYAKAGKDDVSAALYSSSGWKDITLNKEWSRYSTTMKSKKGNHYYPLLIRVKAPVTVWVDAYQFEEGNEATPYKNKEPVSLGVYVPSKYNYIFFPAEKIKIDISAYKAWKEAEAENMVLSYRITDFYKNVVISGEEKLNLDKKRWFKKSFSFNPERLGIFVVRAQIKKGRNLIGNSISTFALVKPPVKIENGLEPFCGICTGSGLPFPGLKRIGVQWIQTRVNWRGIERVKGKYNWGYLDKMLPSLKKQGFKNKIIFRWQDAPKWTRDKKEIDECKTKKIKRIRLLPSTEGLKDWKEFIHQFAIRYDDVIDIYEIGGEDDLVLGHSQYYRQKYPEEVKNNFSIAEQVMDRYAEMITIAAREIKKVNPDAKIGAIRPSGVDCTWARPRYIFSEAVFKKCGKEFNLFPLDPYGAPWVITQDKPLPRVPEDFLPEAFKHALELGKKYGCSQHVYVSELGWILDENEPADGKYSREFVKRLVRVFLLSRMTEGVDYCNWWHSKEGTYYEKMRGLFPGYCMGLWCGYPKAHAPAYSVVAKIVENVIKSREIYLAEEVKAVVFKKPRHQADAAIWFIRGEERGITISANPESISIFDVMGNSVKTRIKGKEINFEIGELPVYLSMKGKGCFKSLYKILSSAKVDIAPVKISFNIPQIDKGVVYIKNRLNHDLTADVYLEIAGKTLTRNIKVPKRGKVSVDFLLQDNIVNQGKVKVEVDCGKKFDRVTTFFPMKLKFETVKRIAFPVKIDGDISEWKGHPYILMNKRGQILPPDPWINWNGPEDLSARVYVGWDRKNFYLAAEVTDDKHFNNKTGYHIWNGDSIQFAFDPLVDACLKETTGYDSDDYDLGIALTKGGPASHRWVGSYKDIWQGSEFSIIRDEIKKKTFYEIRIPLVLLHISPNEGNIFAFNFVIFDDDEGAGQTYWYQNSPGIAGGKNPYEFKKFVMVK